MAESARDSSGTELFPRLNTPEGAKAMEALSEVTPEDLIASYRRGTTETGATDL